MNGEWAFDLAPTPDDASEGFDVLGHVEAGENTIAVRVYKWTNGSYLGDQDVWRLSGVFRGVYCTLPDTHVSDVDVRAELDDSADRRRRAAVDLAAADDGGGVALGTELRGPDDATGTSGRSTTSTRRTSAPRRTVTGPAPGG